MTEEIKNYRCPILNQSLRGKTSYSHPSVDVLVKLENHGIEGIICPNFKEESKECAFLVREVGKMKGPVKEIDLSLYVSYNSPKCIIKKGFKGIK